jgi:predicted ATPase
MTEFPPFRLDKTNQCLWRCDDTGAQQRVPLKPKAFEVLRYLIEHAGRLVAQDEILQAVWPDVSVQPDVLKRHIFDIRTELGDDPKHPRFIETLPRRGYQFIAAACARELAETVGSPRTDQIVGRAAALAQLESCLLKSFEGRRQIIFVTGETGIGKSTVVGEFQRRASKNSAIGVAKGQCLEGYSGREAYYPVLEALGSLCRRPQAETTVEILAAHAPTWLVQFPWLLQPRQRETLEREISGATRQRMVREMADALERITASVPLLLIVEDLHWADHSTVDLISALARGRAPARLLLVATYRPGDAVISNHPFHSLAQDLLVRQLCHELPLGPLSESEIGAYVLHQSPDSVPEGLVDLLYRYSEGNPLYLEAALRHLTGRGFLSRTTEACKLNGTVEAIGLEVPDGIRSVFEAQLDRLDPEHRRALEVASVVGTSFCSTLSARAANIDQERFEQCCERLSRLYQIVRPTENKTLPDGTTSQNYAFVHGLHREVLYRRQSSGRRTELHLQIAEQLERRFAHQLSDHSQTLAEHFEGGGDWTRAIKYTVLSGDAAARRGAHHQAAAALRHALDLIDRVPEQERAAIDLQTLEKLADENVFAADPSAAALYKMWLGRTALRPEPGEFPHSSQQALG